MVAFLYSSSLILLSLNQALGDFFCLWWIYLGVIVLASERVNSLVTQTTN